jgi:hypothetical protein
LQHNWFQIPLRDVTHSVALFLISWAIVLFLLMLGLVVLALVLPVFGTLNGSSGLNKLADYAMFGASAIGSYLFLSASSVALGGPPFQLGRPLRS